MAQDGKIAFDFTGGVVGSAVADVIQPPGFAVSRNGRYAIQRGAPVKCPQIETLAGFGAVGERCTALMPHPASGTAYIGLDRPMRATRSGIRQVQRHDGSPDAWFGASRSLAIADAGVTMPGRSVAVPSVAVDINGGRWFAQIKQKEVRSYGGAPFDGTLAVYVSYTSASGEALVSSQYVCDVDVGQSAILGSPAWCSITCHDAAAVIWYRGFLLIGGPRPIYARKLTLVGTALSVGSEVTVASPSLQCHQPAVFSRGANEAWLAFPMATTTLRTVRWSAATMAATAVRDESMLASLADASCSLYVTSSELAGVVAVIAPATQYHAVFAPSTLTLTESRFVAGPGVAGTCAALYADTGGGFQFAGLAYSCASVAMPATSTTAAAYPRVRIEAKQIGGATVTTGDIGHMRLASAYAIEYQTELASAAMLAVTPWYGPFTSPAERAYVADPALYLCTAWLGFGTMQFGWHARVAVDRMQSHVSSVASTVMPAGSAVIGASMQVSGSRACVTYLERSETVNLISDAGLVGRYVAFDLGSYQPPVAQVGSLLALGGGALPLYWDGSELSDVMPMQIPVVHQSSAGGTTAAVPVSHTYIAIVYWRDAQGALHRSPPSLPCVVSLGVGDTIPDILVTIPPSLHDGGACDKAICRLYYAGTAAGTSGVYRLMPGSPSASTVNGCWRFSAPGAVGVSPISPALYSDGSAGSEVVPEPPPPAQDVCVALDRVFAIDAESRSDVWYSKPLQPGIAPEFSGVFRVTFPAQAGKLIALAEIGGQLVAVGDSGVATLYGDGPDSGGAGGFGPPRILSRQGGVNRQAVGRYPGGVVFLGSDDRWHRLDASGVQPMPNAPFPGGAPVRGWTLCGNGAELAFWLDAEAHVYNYQLDQWYTWTQSVAGTDTAVVVAAENDGSNSAWLVQELTNELGQVSVVGSYLDASQPSTTEQLEYQTGWIVPGGDQQLDCEWAEVVIHAIHEGSHGLVVQVDSDFGNASQTSTRTWTVAELDALRDATSSRYTVGVEIAHRKARALRIRVVETDAVGTAFRPVSCIVYFSVNGSARRPLRPGARK